MFYKLIWKYFSTGLITHYLKDQNKPLQLSQLQYAFTDITGKKYYRFPNDTSLPMDRYIQLTKFLTLMSAKLTQNNIKDITDKILSFIQIGIDKDKNAARIAALCFELQTRDQWIIPHQLIYDVLAVQYVREDENPTEFIQEIHMQKVDQFSTDISKHSFFFGYARIEKTYKFCNDVRIRMDELLSNINGSGSRTKRDFESYFIKKIIQDNEKDQQNLMMMMVDGDISQYNELKKLSVKDYLIKFEYFCKEIERQQPKK